MVLKSSIASLDKKARPRMHLVGIKGVGMTGLAQLFKARGFRVSGSDTHEKFFTDSILKRLRIPVTERFRVKNIRGANLIIASNAYLGKKPVHLEIAAARKKGIPVFSYPDAIAQLFNNAYGIAISGTHGKSTLSAMLAVTLEKLRADPTALIGAEVLNWHTTARVGKSFHPIYHLPSTNYFVLEADEYKRAFLKYQPRVIVITSVDWDHPDVFPTPARYRSTFAAFIKKLPKEGTVIYWGDSPAVRAIASHPHKNIRALSYGTDRKNLVRIFRIAVTPRGTRFYILFHGKRLGRFTVSLVGRQHALNAGAVIAACLTLGFEPFAIRKALAAFRGTRRRFEILNPQCLVPRAQCPLIIDDYGHHPTEIEATISATREAFPTRRLLVLFQPHTFSRTQALFSDFVTALKKADETFILATYGSAREKRGRVGSEELARALSCPHFTTQKGALGYISKVLGPRDIFLAMGAGDQWQIAKTLAKRKKP